MLRTFASALLLAILATVHPASAQKHGESIFSTSAPHAILIDADGGSVLFEKGADELLWRRPILEGKMQARVRVKGGGPALVTLQSGAFSADERETGGAEVKPPSQRSRRDMRNPMAAR